MRGIIDMLSSFHNIPSALQRCGKARLYRILQVFGRKI